MIIKKSYRLFEGGIHVKNAVSIERIIWNRSISYYSCGLNLTLWFKGNSYAKDKLIKIDFRRRWKLVESFEFHWTEEAETDHRLINRYFFCSWLCIDFFLFVFKESIFSWIFETFEWLFGFGKEIGSSSTRCLIYEWISKSS